MAEQLSDLDSGTLDASTKLDKAKNVEDPIRSPHHIDLSRTKSINPRKSPKQESKTDYSDNPKEFRRDFSNKELDLSGCDFKKFPKGFKYCPDLEELNLSNNPRIHLDISSLKIHKYCLKKLNLSGCGLTKLPKGFRFCRILEELNLSNNPLSHSDISFFELSKCSLKNLDLSGCDLTKLPEGLKDCHKLEELNLSNNPLSHSDISFLELSKCSLKKLDLSGCGLTELPKDSEECRKLEELNFSNNSFDHQDLLEKLISGKVFSLGLHQSDRERFKFTDTGGDLFMLSKPTCRIIFEDAIYTQSAGGWMVVDTDVASTHYKGKTRKEILLDEFCRIRKSQKLTIETYHCMLQSLKIVHNLISMNNVKNRLERESTLNRCCRQIECDLIDMKLTITPLYHAASQYVQKCILYLKWAVSWLKPWSIRADDNNYNLNQSITTSEMAFKEAFEAFSKESCLADKILAAKLMIISAILSKLTKPEAAVLRCLQSLQELHDLHTIRKVFSSLDRGETKTTYLKKEESVEIVKSVLKINKILFEFVGMFFKPPPTVKEWPATIQLDEQIYNPLIDGRLFEDSLIDTGVAVSGSVNLDIGEDDNKVKDPITDATEYSVPIIESADNSITVDPTGGCFSLPEASAFLLFPPNAVEEKVTLKCCRVKYKECEVKPSDGEVFVSWILKVEPEGLTFKKPVTVLLSHSLDEDQVFLYFYELIVENLSPTGCQELKTERISSIEDVPKEISNKEILENDLPFAKATIRETCTLVAATRARFNQILIPTNRRYAFSKQYGDHAELKITFPAGVTEKILNLNVQLFPANAVLNKDIRLNKSLVYPPIIRVSGQTTPFLKAVEVELTYYHSDVVNIEENFLPVGTTTQFTTEYGMLLHNHKETESKYNWQALNESNDVSIERLRKDQLKFSFSVKHFSDIQPVVKTSTAVSFVPPMNASMVNMNNPGCRRAIVLAVHKSGSTPKTLHAVLAPKQAERHLLAKWEVKGCPFSGGALKCEEPVYFCVPMSDTTESDHLLLKDYTLWFDPEDESELANNTEDGVDLEGKYMRFLKDRECNNGENHTTQGDCRAKFRIHISETRSVQVDRRSTNFDLSLPTVNTPSTESREPVLDIESPQEHNVSSGAEDAQMNNNQISEIMMRRCELFVMTVETAAQKKLEINKAFAEDPKGGKATKIVDVAGPTTTVVASLACGIITVISIPTFGAASFAAVLVTGGTLGVKYFDKRSKQTNAKVVEEVLETATEISSYLNCIVKDVAKELSRIFESQLFELQSDKQVELLAECAVDLMLDLKKGDTFDRNTLLKKVLQNGEISKKKLLTEKGKEWYVPSVFRKPGLRRMIFGKKGVEFKYFVKPNEACDTSKYGYRSQFLENKECSGQKKEGENGSVISETSATHETHENACKEFCKECPSNNEKCNGQYFVESDIDSQYTVSQREPYTYHPMHILILCPKVLDFFTGHALKEARPSLANFLKKKLRLSEDHLVHPVYRPHSPGKVPDLQKSDLTGSDFSHSDFTDSCLEGCNFTKCVMLFTQLARAKMSGSVFCETLISHSNLEAVDAKNSSWIKTYVHYSRVDCMDLSEMKNYGDISWEGTNVDKAIRNFNNNLAEAKASRTDNNSMEVEADQCDRTKTSPLHSNMDGPYRDSGKPSTSGNFFDETNISNAISGQVEKLNYTETAI